MNEEELNNFINIFRGIYEILFYLKRNEEYTQLCGEIEEELIETLKSLN